MNLDISYIETLQPISAYLPYSFNNHSTKIENISVRCSKCGAEIQARHIRGSLSSTGQCVTLLAYALCYADLLIIPVELRLGPTGEMLAKGPDGWVQSSWSNKRHIGLLEIIKRFFRER